MARIHALHEFPPFATPYAKSCFCFPSLWQSKRKKPNFFAKNDSGKTLAEVTDSTRSTRKKGRSGTDHQRVWDTAEDEPEYPGWSFV